MRNLTLLAALLLLPFLLISCAPQGLSRYQCTKWRPHAYSVWSGGVIGANVIMECIEVDGHPITPPSSE